MEVPFRGGIDILKRSAPGVQLSLEPRDEALQENGHDRAEFRLPTADRPFHYNQEDCSMKFVKVLQMMFVVGGVTALAAAPGYSQTTAPKAPAGNPPATQPPAAQTPATPPPTQPTPLQQPPRPFPEGAKFAFVDIQAIASNSAEGKAASAKLDDLKKKKNADLLAKNTALKTMQDKLNAGGSVMNDQARGQLEKDIEKAQRDLQFAQQDAQTELTDMTNQLQADFQEKLNPVLEAVRAEKGLLMIFSIRDSGVVAAEGGLDLSSEVVKRFDSANKATSAPAPAAAPATTPAPAPATSPKPATNPKK
jgi:outer membrane protein